MSDILKKVKLIDWARGVISTAVVTIFGYAYLNNVSDEMMKGAIIAAFSLVVSYWLGSSKGSDDKTQMLANGHGTTENPDKVEVVNPLSDPIPTTDTPFSIPTPVGTGVPDKPVWEK